MSDLPNILLIDKPPGMSSFDVIRLLREKTGVKKMGHAGTLDPLATGLMIIGVEEGTKELSKLIKLPKSYTARILLGASTDTADLEGKVTNVVSTTEVDPDMLEEVIAGMKGVNKLAVPRYSAVKVEGTPLYKYARAGIPITLPVRDMKVRDIKLIEEPQSDPFIVKEGHISFEESDDESPQSFGVSFGVSFDVESGVYIRSLAEEIGRKMGLPSVLEYLRRTQIGDFHISEALGLDEF